MLEPTFLYKEFVPAEPLQRFIKCYWMLERKSTFATSKRFIFADGLAEIFVNLGTNISYIDDIVPLKPGRLYFGGTMTNTTSIVGQPNSTYAGIRFKPGGFSAFYKLASWELVDKIVDFTDPELYSLMYFDDKLGERLDKFFLPRIDHRILSVISISESVSLHQGQITVDELARKHNISRRSLERHFNAAIGVGPKEFIKVIRFHHLIQKLQKKQSQESLLQIAYEMGYYDHAHLTKEVRRYGGQNPSELMNSELSSHYSQ